ncbi:MAG: NAD(P)-binding domain-containing protein, partial [Actinomycetota bacterium]
MDVAIVGGTGKEGFGLALRLLGAGHRVTIGSRSAERAAEAVERARQAFGIEVQVAGAENAGSVVGAEVVAVTVPFEGMIEIYASIGPALRSG